MSCRASLRWSQGVCAGSDMSVSGVPQLWGDSSVCVRVDTDVTGVCAVTYFQTDGGRKQSSEIFQKLIIQSHTKEQAQEQSAIEGLRDREIKALFQNLVRSL